MTVTETALALLALLVSPGPTNALLLLAGAERGLRAARTLPLVVLAAYTVTVLPLSLAGQWVAESVPLIRPLVTLAAAAWVAVLALRLWWGGRDGSTAPLSARQLGMTTLLNPKALIFGVALIPGPSLSATAANLGVFLAMVPASALVWIAVGTTLPRHLPLLRRASALWLAGIASLLTVRALG